MSYVFHARRVRHVGVKQCMFPKGTCTYECGTFRSHTSLLITVHVPEGNMNLRHVVRHYDMSYVRHVVLYNGAYSRREYAPTTCRTLRHVVRHSGPKVPIGTFGPVLGTCCPKGNTCHQVRSQRDLTCSGHVLPLKKRQHVPARAC